jgi:hypothetical protein
MSTITITNSEIVDFYSSHETINIEEINIFFIKIIQQLSTNLSATVNELNITKLINMVTDVNKKLDKYDNSISLKLMEFKSEYISNLKEITSASSLLEISELKNAMDRSNDTLLAKTSVLINDFIPQTQAGHKEIENVIKCHYASILETSKTLLTHTDTANAYVNITEAIDKQFTKMMGLIQTPICNYIQQSEERTNTNLVQMNNKIHEQQQHHKGLTVELTNFLDKYKNNSSSKGNVSESELYYVIQSVMPSDQIIKCSSETAACDIRVNRKDDSKPSILFENKNYMRSVDTEEISKFERDVCIQKKCGIFISQKSPIVFKDEFHVDIINGLVLVYIPNANYNPDKIRVAVNIIDHLFIQITEINKALNGNKNIDSTAMPPAILNKLIKEYTEFGVKKIEIAEFIKNTTKQMTDKLDDLRLPSLDSFLIGTGKYKSDRFGCPLCSFSGKNKSSLSAHLRTCKKEQELNKIKEQEIKEQEQEIKE